MTDLRFFVVPAALLAIVAGYVALNPTGAAVEPIATETPAPTASDTSTPVPPHTPSPTPAPFPGQLQLSELSGTLTYQSTGLVSVEFPSGAIVDIPPGATDATDASGGEWTYEPVCDDRDGACTIRFVSSSGQRTELAERFVIWHVEWRDDPTSRAVVFAVSPPGDTTGMPRQVLVVTDPAGPASRTVYDAGEGAVGAVTWYNRDLLISSTVDGMPRLHVVEIDGTVRASAPGGSSRYFNFNAAPDGEMFAYTASDAAGWRLFTVNAATLDVTDHGPMGSDGPDGVPVPDPPDGGKGPMSIAWSPDATRLAFGGGFEPPYSMKVVDVWANTTVTTGFASGYPGEIRWSPDGKLLAVSTYDTERTHHETWVVDPLTGAGKHLMDGCVIVWSPDSRFLAVHGEDIPGIAIVDVASGARMQLTANSTDAPLTWTD
jgi:hypothetical protein